MSWQPSARVPDAGPKGTPDGFRVHVDGNLWCGCGMGEAGANVCFGGLHRNRLFMAATTSLYALYVNTQGTAYF